MDQERRGLTGSSEDSEHNEQSLSPDQRRRETRRRLLKAGALSVPVILTVRSRPVLGQSLGSAGISYGAYFQSENELVPVLSDEQGMPVDVDGKTIDPTDPNAKTRYRFMEDPNRRTPFNSIEEGTYSWTELNQRKNK